MSSQKQQEKSSDGALAVLCTAVAIIALVIGVSEFDWKPMILSILCFVVAVLFAANAVLFFVRWKKVKDFEKADLE